MCLILIFVKILNLNIMKKLFLLLVFILSLNFCFSQITTEKWNEYKKQYEYFDSNGNMTAYKVYNAYKKQWETYSVQSNTYQPQPVINTELVQKTLTTLQAKYDANFARLQEQVKTCYIIIQGAAKIKGYSYDDGLKAVNFFKLNYIDKVSYGGYDLSSNATTEKLIDFLSDGSFKIACDYFKYCE